MIVFYAATNTTLINITNAKINNYSEEDADLIIRFTNAISEDLVQSIRDSDIFKNIYYVGMPEIQTKFLPIAKIPNVKMLFYNRAYKNYYNRILNLELKNKKYDRFITFGFWSASLCILDYLQKYNPIIRVDFIEEGSVTYKDDRQVLYKHSTTKGISRRLLRFFREGSLITKYKKLVDSINIYQPELYRGDSKLQIKRLPAIDNKNKQCKGILEKAAMNIDRTHFIRYEKKSVIYLTSYFNDIENNTAIDLTLETVNKKSIIIKNHTQVTDHRLNFARDYETEIYVDREVYLFEALLSQLDIDNKIFIAINSSILMNFKFLLGKEPYVIYLYRLFASYRTKGDDETDEFVERLRELYTEKEKVIVPNTVQEFREMLEAAQRRIFEDSIRL